MKLADQLSAKHQAARDSRTPEILEVLNKSVATVAESGIADKSLGVGEKAPNFTLPNSNGELVSLDELLKSGPVVISFYRGGWCPYCNLELMALQSALDEFKQHGASLIAISPELPDNSLTTKEKLELAFPVLSDIGNIVARDFGLVFTISDDLKKVYDGFGLDIEESNGDDSYELPIPATYVIGHDGVVVWRFADADYTKRAEPSDVLDAVKNL